MHSRYALVACLSLLLQTAPGARKNTRPIEADPSEPAPIVPAPSLRKIVAHGIDLESDTATIRSSALPVLREVVELLGSEGAVVMIVDPPADEHRSDTYHEFLQRRRAKAIRRYLVEDGIALDRIAFPADAESTITTADASHSRPMELHVQ